MALLIESVIKDAAAIGIEVELLELSWLERSRTRQRCRTNTGRELALALPRGTVLVDGDLLANTAELSIIVRACPESLVTIAPANAEEFCRIAHHLGNWHRSLQFVNAELILTELDGPLEEWLRRNEISYKLDHRPYSPNMLGIQHKISFSI